MPLVISIAKRMMFAWLFLFTLSSLTAAQTFTNLFNFDSVSGSTPNSVVQDRDDNLVGTTEYRGANSCGTVFAMTVDGMILKGSSLDCTQVIDVSGLILGPDGKFYGNAQLSGGRLTPGALFKVSTAGVTVIHDFDGTDGENPIDGLTLGSDGNYYGVTLNGGTAPGCGTIGCGTVFKTTPTGTLQTLFNFDDNHGASPVGGLVQGTDGNFYGTTTVSSDSCGNIFRITPKGSLSVLHKFVCGEAYQPVASMIQGSDGNFYGTSMSGGSGGDGTVFRVSPSGDFTVLFNFNGGTDGGNLRAALVQGTDGNFYGTTCGNSTGGTIFQITPSGVLTTLHNFTGADGWCSNAAMVQHTNGIFYGTTSAGGNLSCSAPYGCGTVFSLDMGLPPFITFVNKFGRIGAGVQILGQNLTGTTSVTFNGIPATSFTVVSDTFMSAVVPAGATSGPVQAITPTGTLTSKVNFQVVP